VENRGKQTLYVGDRQKNCSVCGGQTGKLHCTSGDRQKIALYGDRQKNFLESSDSITGVQIVGRVDRDAGPSCYLLCAGSVTLPPSQLKVIILVIVSRAMQTGARGK